MRLLNILGVDEKHHFKNGKLRKKDIQRRGGGRNRRVIRI